MNEHRCRWPHEHCERCCTISAAQRRIGRRPVTLRTPIDYRRTGRWWELEAGRGYASAWRSRIYAQTMFWCAELAGLFGDWTFLELLERSGHSHPYPKGLPDTEAEWIASRRAT